MLRARSGAALLMVGLAVLLLIPLCAGCKGGKKQSQEVAVVDGQTITAMDVLAATDPEQRSQMAVMAIQRILVEREAKRYNIEVTDADVQSQLEKIIEEAGGQEEFTKQIAPRTQADIMADLKFARSLQLLQVRDVPDKSDDELQAFYEKNQEAFGTPERVKVRMILSSDRTKAEQASARLKKGEDFTAVEAETSERPGTAAQWYPLASVQPAGLLAAVSELGAKGVTAPVEVPLSGTQKGWIVCMVEDRQAADMPALESIKAEVQLQAKLADPKSEDYRLTLTNIMIDKKIEIVDDQFTGAAAMIETMQKSRVQTGAASGMVPAGVESQLPAATEQGAGSAQ